MSDTTINSAQTDIQDDIIQTLRDVLAKGEEIDIRAMAVDLELDHSMTKVRNFLINGQMATKAEWNSAIKVSKTVKELGFYPSTASQLVAKYIEKNDIKVDFQKAMKRTTAPTLDGLPITADARKDRHVDAIARIKENKALNTDTLKRDLRMKVEELGLRFNAMSIDDAVSAWFDEALSERVAEVYAQVGFTGSPNSKENLEAWDAVVAQFDTTEHNADFIVAILKKFIWQVKRKMQGMPIENHLMPVITGAQGKGKSTFVRDYLLEPVSELVSNTDFGQIEEVRNTEQWRNYVLFLDEMGYAGKADIDNVKNKITAPSVTGRPMRSNDNVQYSQNATFIGCSNKELNQLIRDETGNRRFVSLRYSSSPDWAKLNNLKPHLLWMSVDERDEDPTKGIADELRAAQALVREKSMVEQWLEDYKVPTLFVGKKRKSSEWYPEFKSWFNDFGSGRVPDVAYFGKEFTRLINNNVVVDWSLGKLNGTSVYIYK
jgi:hypothetical protein